MALKDTFSSKKSVNNSKKTKSRNFQEALEFLLFLYYFVNADLHFSFNIPANITYGFKSDKLGELKTEGILNLH